MVAKGRVKNGVVVLSDGVHLPEGQEVTVLAPNGATAQEDNGWPPGYFENTFWLHHGRNLRASAARRPAQATGAGMIYLLDSNVCIQYMRGRQPLVLQRLSAKPLHEIRLMIYRSQQSPLSTAARWVRTTCRNSAA